MPAGSAPRKSCRLSFHGKEAKTVAPGQRIPWRLAVREVKRFPTDNIAFEGPFLKAWYEWRPTVRSPAVLPNVQFGSQNQPRLVIFRVVRSLSPFKLFRSEGINPEPFGCTPEKFLNDWCFELSASDWLHLADLFIQELEARKAKITYA